MVERREACIGHGTLSPSWTELPGGSAGRERQGRKRRQERLL